ncbi:hypothetical protein [Salinibacter grassmerensis]|uniref:hypothetical protein n=1 Tax=Salinibacter grassmerensis TaxID=3040353 RepID=UPI0021E9A875|nr:hypothetical protein [Salinibacter grassmerensis]
MSTCTATNKDGTPCSNSAAAGSVYCHVHQDADASTSADEHGFGVMLASALTVILVTHFLLQFVLGA